MKLLGSEQVFKEKKSRKKRLFSSILMCSLGLFVFGGGRKKKMITLIFFRWLSSLWLNLVIADVKWHPIAFKMGFTAFQQATLPSRQLGAHTSTNEEGTHVNSQPSGDWLIRQHVTGGMKKRRRGILNGLPLAEGPLVTLPTVATRIVTARLGN